MLEDGGMEQPDEVEYDLAANELIFFGPRRSSR